MSESERDDGESVPNRTTRREALRIAAGAGATGALGVLGGCAGGLKNMKPSGQTLAYKTPQGELREGTLSVSLADETTTPHAKVEADPDQYAASVGDIRGQLSLSPDATEVAFVGTNDNGIGNAIVLQSLSGGDTRYTRPQLQKYWGSALQSIAIGNLLSVTWCPASSSDTLVLTVDGWDEADAQVLFEVDTDAEDVQLFKTSKRPDIFSPNVAWSPSCDKLAYKEEPKETREDSPITVLDIDSEKNTQRVQNGKDPAWGDTGIAFVRNGNVYLDRQSDTVQLTGSSATDSNPVIFEQAPGESLAFLRGEEIYLIKRIDELGTSPNPTVKRVWTEEPVETFDIVA